MQITLPDDLNLADRAAAAGYSDVAEYLAALVERDADLAAIQRGLADANAGRLQSLEEFDAEFRAKHNIAADQ